MNLLLFVISAFLILHQATSEDVAQMIDRITKTCAEQNGVSFLQVKDVMSNDELPEDNEDFIRFYDCLMSGIGMYNENGEVHFERVPDNKPEYIIERLGNDIDTKLILEAFDYCNNQPKVLPRALDAIKRRNCGLKYIKNKI